MQCVQYTGDALRLDAGQWAADLMWTQSAVFDVKVSPQVVDLFSREKALKAEEDKKDRHAAYVRTSPSLSLSGVDALCS